MKSYVKRPFVIKALQWDGTIGKLHDTEIWQHMVTGGTERGVRYGILRTPEGDMKFHKGDYIVKGVCGEIYPVKKEIFEKTYREASDLKKDAPFKDGPDLEKLWAEQEKQLAESDLIVVKKKNLLDVLSMAIKTRNTFPLILPCLGEGTDCCKSGGHCTHDDCPFYNDDPIEILKWLEE